MAKKRIQITLKKNILDMLVKEAIKENLSKSELLEKILDESDIEFIISLISKKCL